MISTIKQHIKQLLFRMILLCFKPLLFFLRRVSTGNEAYTLFSEYGYHLLRKHYYLPIPEAHDLRYQRESELPGIHIDETRIFELLEQVVLPYKPGFNALPVDAPDKPATYYLLNGNFMAIDGNLYYALIRHLHPQTIIEIGCGNSTFLAIQAIKHNIRESRPASRVVCIEPYPRLRFEEQLPEFAELHCQNVQDMPLEFFESLQTGDILFIDSTHVLRSGGDVWWEYCEILPRLQSGVYVHVHDISLPKPYPRAYFDCHYYWNEQYLLQAFLTYNSKIDIIWPGNYLMTRYPKKMRAVFSPEYDLMRAMYPSSEPVSFWMRVR